MKKNQYKHVIDWTLHAKTEILRDLFCVNKTSALVEPEKPERIYPRILSNFDKDKLYFLANFIHHLFTILLFKNERNLGVSYPLFRYCVEDFSAKISLKRENFFGEKWNFFMASDEISPGK